MAHNTLKIFIPVKPNWAKGDAKIVNKGLPQWLKNKRGCCHENLAQIKCEMLSPPVPLPLVKIAVNNKAIEIRIKINWAIFCSVNFMLIL
jgi:hypothetical protein